MALVPLVALLLAGSCLGAPAPSTGARTVYDDGITYGHLQPRRLADVRHRKPRAIKALSLSLHWVHQRRWLHRARAYVPVSPVVTVDFEHRVHGCSPDPRCPEINGLISGRTVERPPLARAPRVTSPPVVFVAWSSLAPSPSRITAAAEWLVAAGRGAELRRIA
ncbi:hypothetical protein GUJ93_ZPchr0006g46300 [Zizania palustris]|uniref:DUF3105 domain-containing protein n=1 Tax=Zizania palustris TaxID=103762 RepID=A0A8J5SZM5_ZIZPA|nr:hypothetical protein GUJ93_ZPchr0006g46300 [Zizania palustris]